MSGKRRNVTNVPNQKHMYFPDVPQISKFKFCFAVVWLGQIHNLDTGLVYLLCLKSGSERLFEL